MFFTRVASATMLKMRCISDVFQGTWPKFTEQLFERTFSNVCKAKTSGVLTQWCLGTFNAGCNKRTYIPKQTCKSQLKVCLSMYDFLLPSGIKGLKVFWRFLSKNQTKSEASRQLFSLKKLFRKFLENSQKNIGDRVYNQHICKPSSWQIC